MSTDHVLVAYASKHGSTREVAETVAVVLRERGLDVAVEPAGAVATVDGYSAVVLGAALYMGQLHKDALSFLKTHGRALREIPFAVFAMGPKTPADEEIADSRAQLERGLSQTPELRPSSIAVFGGVVDPAKLHFPLNRLPASDARDWDAIAAWADEVATLFSAGEDPAQRGQSRDPLGTPRSAPARS